MNIVSALIKKSCSGLSKLKTFMIFVVLGPPVGGLVTFLTLVVYANGNFSKFEPQDILAGLGVLLAVLLVSYVVGVIPAALCGLIIGRMPGLVAQQMWRNLLWLCVVGAAITSLCTVGVVFINFVIEGRLGTNINFISKFAFLAVSGAVAAMFCGYIALRAGGLAPPSGAKEPTP